MGRRIGSKNRAPLKEQRMCVIQIRESTMQRWKEMRLEMKTKNNDELIIYLLDLYCQVMSLNPIPDAIRNNMIVPHLTSQESSTNEGNVQSTITTSLMEIEKNVYNGMYFLINSKNSCVPEDSLCLSYPSLVEGYQSESTLGVIKVEEVEAPIDERTTYNIDAFKSESGNMLPITEEYGESSTNCFTTSTLPEENFPCSVCGLTFPQQKYLNIHEEMHYTFTCEVCCKRFSSESDLNQHVGRHTEGDAYKCFGCDRQFNHYRNFTRHLKIHTGEKSCKCQVCGREFKRSDSLRRHIKIHSGEGQYKCSRCDKEYRSKNELTTHMKDHAVEKNYECNECNRLFNRGSDLTRHKKVHQKNVN